MRIIIPRRMMLGKKYIENTVKFNVILLEIKEIPWKQHVHFRQISICIRRSVLAY